MENLNILKELGLDDQEASVYMALLKLGGSQASVVAKDVGIKRTTVYPVLQALAAKGMVNVYFRKNRHFYYAQKPNRVVGIFKKKIESFESIIPMLELVEKKQVMATGLRFIETVEELKQFYNGILDEYKGKQYLAIGNTAAWEGLEPEFFVNFRRQRAENKIKTKLLLTFNSVEINPIETSLLREWKYLPEKYKFQSTIDIFNDKILIVSPELSSLAVVIAVPAMTDIFKSVFEMLWQMLPEVK
ncbi:MAG: helix-turn-helix domain-containing protein [Candidatus Magasanikbacteria bacterium]|jgi:sugar-specific transcriptional regulator TrmB